MSRISDLNDQFRKEFLHTPVGRNKAVVTNGVLALDGERFAIYKKVAEYKDFPRGDDPHREHDFGAFDHGDHHIFWKIDYYAPDMESGSEDPSDETKTVRVLTIMLAEEY